MSAAGVGGRIARVISGRRKLGLARREAIEGYVCILPWIVGLLVFTAGPMLASFYLSLTEYPIIAAPRYVGLAQYERIFADESFWIAVTNTIYYAAIFIPLSLAGSLCCAMLLNQNIVGRAFWRSVYFLPSITPTVAAVFIWAWILQPRIGVLNYLLSGIGITGPGWLGSPAWSKPALILISLWLQTGGNRMLVFLSGLQGIPTEFHEAAEIDGASAWQRFWRITIPLLSPTMFFNLILGMIGALQAFAIAYVASASLGQDHQLGGPARSTLMYVLYMYIRSFHEWAMGYGAALATVFFVGVLCLTMLQLYLARHWVYYEAGESEPAW